MLRESIDDTHKILELLGLKMIKPAYWTNVLSKFDMALCQLIHNIISPVNPDPNKYIVQHHILAI